MSHLPFTTTSVSLNLAYFDSAILSEGEDPITEVARTIMDNLGISIDVTIGETRMHLAAWIDPDHWSEDWVKALGCTHEDASERVQEIIEGAITR